MNIISKISDELVRKDIPKFRSGDTVAVHTKIKEGEKERIQIFEGMVIRRHGGGVNSTFTVRKISCGVGVERIFPLHSPLIDHIEVTARGKVRRARLYYLRDLSGKAARIKERAYEASGQEGETTAAADQPPGDQS